MQVSGTYGDEEETVLYGVFNTPPNSIGGSAVCSFRLADISSAFEGQFKEQRNTGDNWLAVDPHRVPSPRPGKVHLLIQTPLPIFWSWRVLWSRNICIFGNACLGFNMIYRGWFSYKIFPFLSLTQYQGRKLNLWFPLIRLKQLKASLLFKWLNFPLQLTLLM